MKPPLYQACKMRSLVVVILCAFFALCKSVQLSRTEIFSLENCSSNALISQISSSTGPCSPFSCAPFSKSSWASTLSCFESCSPPQLPKALNVVWSLFSDLGCTCEAKVQEMLFAEGQCVVMKGFAFLTKSLKGGSPRFYFR